LSFLLVTNYFCPEYAFWHQGHLQVKAKFIFKRQCFSFLLFIF
jgi:hypothetical protein